MWASPETMLLPATFQGLYPQHPVSTKLTPGFHNKNFIPRAILEADPCALEGGVGHKASALLLNGCTFLRHHCPPPQPSWPK